MKEKFADALRAFGAIEFGGIKSFVGWFAKSVTVGIIKNDKEILKELSHEAMDMRAELEFEHPIVESKDYYLGLFTAYSTIANRTIEVALDKERIDLIVEQQPKLRLQQIIRFLGSEGFVPQSKIAENLNISPSHLWNILNKPVVKQLNLFSLQKIGKNAIYGLNVIGKEYYEKKMNSDLKQYSKKEILDILSAFMQAKSLYDEESLIEKSKIFDKDLVEGIFEKFYESSICDMLDIKADYDRIPDEFRESSIKSIDYGAVINKQVGQDIDYGQKRNDKAA